MTDKVPLDRIGEYMEAKMDMLMRAVVLEADKLVKEGSPVDTGRFAVSWQIGEGTDKGIPAKKGKYGTPGVGTVVRAPRGSNYRPGTEQIGKVYYIHNNLPYAEKLCYQGHSKKVDSNWFEMVAKEMQRLSKEFWKDIAKGDLK